MIDDVRRDAQTLLDESAGERADVADERHRVDRLEIARVLFVVAIVPIVCLHLWEPWPHASVIGIAAVAIGGYPIFREAFVNARDGRMTMELSMTIALVAALAIGQAFTALVITAFVLAAEILEHLTVARGRAAIGNLLAFLPRSALVRRHGAMLEVRSDELVIGDAVLVNPGALIPVDGIIIDGASFVDEARITGESMPAEKVLGSRAYAGTVNQRGALEIRTERLGRDTSYGRIIDAVESAEQSRAPIERLADRLSGYLVYFALGAAVLTFLITRNLIATISVIIVAGACGIAAGTPLAVLGAVGRAASLGAIIKGGRYLEALAAVDVVVFDKTGTLTVGRPDVRSVFPAFDVTADRLVGIAAIAERRSEHPLGRAIVTEAERRNLVIEEPEAFASTPGRGIRAAYRGAPILAGNAAFLRDGGFGSVETCSDESVTLVHVAYGSHYLGAIGIADTVRSEAKSAVADLKPMVDRIVMLTGDAKPVADAVGKALGIDIVVAALLPAEKSAYVAELVGSGKIVAMIGDGVNDAPALVRATVGIAMGSGTDVTRESADVVLLGNDLSRFVETMRIARRTKGIVLQNFVGTIVVDGIGIALATRGTLDPLLAALVHVVSELVFILNSTRMLAPRTTRGRRGERVKSDAATANIASTTSEASAIVGGEGDSMISGSFDVVRARDHVPRTGPK